MRKETALITPADLKKEHPMTEEAQATVEAGRKDVINILNGRDPRLLVITGPCSIHDVEEALEYARRLKELQTKVAGTMLLVMRVYFEKPRTTNGWKGFINDPDRDGTFNMDKGLREARKILIAINELGIPVATELLDPTTYRYIGDLLSWVAIGARTTESQTHREMASDLDMAVGFKNNSFGEEGPAISAMVAASRSQCFRSINKEGKVCRVVTRGNKNCNIVLRGGGLNPNYDPTIVRRVSGELQKKDLNPNVVIDCSHDNVKDFSGQAFVFNTAVNQAYTEGTSVVGVMLESNLKEGRQDMHGRLKHGVSITDGCISWETTEQLLIEGNGKILEFRRAEAEEKLRKEAEAA